MTTLMVITIPKPTITLISSNHDIIFDQKDIYILKKLLTLKLVKNMNDHIYIKFMISGNISYYILN
jgi:hypothetical protein